RRFYAEGVGLVKQRAYGGIPATVELWEIDDFEQLVRTTILMEIIHGGLQADTSTFHVDAYGGIPRVPIHLTTNNHLLDVLNSILQGTTQAVLGHELPNDARLLSYFVNPATENLHLDFSAGFLREMGLMTNSQNEESFLASLISIFGFFLNVQAGTITVEGQPYLGEHVSIRSMEFWSVEDSFGFLPEIPPYTDEEIAMALSITESMRQPLYDIIGQIIPEFRAVDEDEWHMDEQGRGFVPAAMPFESIDQIRAAVEGVFTEHFITGHFEWSLFDEYWGYFTEVDGQLYHAAADFPVAEIFWWSWEAGEEVNPWHIHDDIFAASIGERNVLFVLEDDGRWLIDDIWLYWQW
ncbi:MAG: GerMN domain-containing protein, partial [Defluviitaleaceae bacterium]|nr:GerMN domain-containing protein [Defluviitaleaceae bacterium]